MKSRRFLMPCLAWIGIWLFWLVATYRFHPTFSLALIVTSSLVAAYATASFVNHMALMPLLLAKQRRWFYSASLIATMAVLTAGALAIIRVSYLKQCGPDADPYGVYKHYVIDLLGMAVHVSAAAAINRRLTRAPIRGL